MFKNKETIKSLTKQFYDWRIAAKDYMHTLKYPSSRQILSANAADAQGKLNGFTVVELLAIVNMANLTGERIELKSANKTIYLFATKRDQCTPENLR